MNWFRKHGFEWQFSPKWYRVQEWELTTVDYEGYKRYRFIGPLQMRWWP